MFFLWYLFAIELIFRFRISLFLIDFCFRTSDVRAGMLVGEDKYGNKYYENPEYFFGMYAHCSSFGNTVNER